MRIECTLWNTNAHQNPNCCELCCERWHIPWEAPPHPPTPSLCVCLTFRRKCFGVERIHQVLYMIYLTKARFMSHGMNQGLLLGAFLGILKEITKSGGGGGFGKWPDFLQIILEPFPQYHSNWKVWLQLGNYCKKVGSLHLFSQPGRFLQDNRGEGVWLQKSRKQQKITLIVENTKEIIPENIKDRGTIENHIREYQRPQHPSLPLWDLQYPISRRHRVAGYFEKGI